MKQCGSALCNLCSSVSIGRHGFGLGPCTGFDFSHPLDSINKMIKRAAWVTLPTEAHCKLLLALSQSQRSEVVASAVVSEQAFEQKVFQSYIEDIEEAEQAEPQQYLGFNFRQQQVSASWLNHSNVIIC